MAVPKGTRGDLKSLEVGGREAPLLLAGDERIEHATSQV